jgi:hypothetical protein
VPDPLKKAPENTDFVKTPTFSWLLPLSSIAIGNANKNDAVYTLIEKVTTLIKNSNAPIAELCKDIIGQIKKRNPYINCHKDYIKELRTYNNILLSKKRLNADNCNVLFT